MLYKLRLKNAPQKFALVDDQSYEYIINNDWLKKIKFLDHLRIHSSGYAFFQKNWPVYDAEGKRKYKNETIYLHKLIATHFVEKPETDKRLCVILQNGNALDCRVENLAWVPLSGVVRNTNKTDNKNGYRGVNKNATKFRAVIYNHGERIDLGLYDTAEEAAIAYNKKSIELFGKTRSLNRIPNHNGYRNSTTGGGVSLSAMKQNPRL